MPAIQRFKRGDDGTGAGAQAAADRQLLAEQNLQRPYLDPSLRRCILVNTAAGNNDIFFLVLGQGSRKRAVQCQLPVVPILPLSERSELDQVTQQAAVHGRQGQAKGVKTDRKVTYRGGRVYRKGLDHQLSRGRQTVLSRSPKTPAAVTAAPAPYPRSTIGIGW